MRCPYLGRTLAQVTFHRAEDINEVFEDYSIRKT